MPARKPAQGTNRESELQRFARELGSKRGLDPIPPFQHEWQGAVAESPLARLWSWMCGHTVVQGVRSAYAMRQGRPATLADAAREIPMQRALVGRAWAEGERYGAWRRDEKQRLWLAGDGNMTQIIEAKKRRKIDCTVYLSKTEISTVQSWPKERAAQFFELWDGLQSYRRQLARDAIWRAREASQRIEDTIRGDFGLLKKRFPSERRPVNVPVVLSALIDATVQSTPVRSSIVPASEPATVPSPASLLIQREEQRSSPPTPPLAQGGSQNGRYNRNLERKTSKRLRQIEGVIDRAFQTKGAGS